MTPRIAQFLRHFVWWFVLVFLLPLLVGVGSLQIPSAGMNKFGTLIIWDTLFLAEQVVRPHLGVLVERVSPLPLLILSYAAACLVFATVTVLLANSALLTDTFSSLRRADGAAKRER